MSKITTSDLSPLRLTSSSSLNMKPTTVMTSSKKVVSANENYLKPSPSAFLISPMILSTSSHPHNSQESNKGSTTATSNHSNESLGANPTSFRDRTNNPLDYNLSSSAQKNSSLAANIHTSIVKKSSLIGANISQANVGPGPAHDSRSATPGIRKSSELNHMQERGQNRDIGSIKEEVQRLRKEFLELKEREGKYQSRITNLERENKVLRDLLRQSEKSLEEEARAKKMARSAVFDKFDKSLQVCLDDPCDSAFELRNSFAVNKLAQKLKEIEIQARALANSKTNSDKQSSCQCKTLANQSNALNRSVDYSQQITALQTQVMELSRKYNEIHNKHNMLLAEHITLRKEKEVFENIINFMCQQSETVDKAGWPNESARVQPAKQEGGKSSQNMLMQLPTPGTLKVLQMASAKHS